jgi:hypothetical protein
MIEIISFYQGAFGAMKQEVEKLRTHFEKAQEQLYYIEGRFLQFKEFFTHIATGPWQPMDSAPKDGTPILVRFESGLCLVCSWDSWTDEEPVAWAEIVKSPIEDHLNKKEGK